MYQIAVRVVDFDDIEACFERALGCVGPARLEHRHVGDGKLSRDDVACRHRLGRGRNRVPLFVATRQVLGRQRPVAVPGPLHGAFAPCMCDLNAGHNALRLHEGGNALQGGHVRRRPQAEIAVGDATLFRDGSSLNEYATRTTQHQAAPMGKMKILGDAGDGRIGGHRRDDDPVLESHVLDGDRCEEQRLGHGSERL